MLQEALLWIPDFRGTAVMVSAGLAVLIGLILWVCGVCFSRYFITLAAVAIGAGVGVNLPRWCGWSFDGTVPAIGGAVLLGVSGFVLHRLWVAIWFGLAVALWAALGAWFVLLPDAPPDFPTRQGAMLPAYLLQIWQSLPPDMTRALPAVCASAFVAAVVPVLIWDHLGMAALYSLLGSSMAFCATVLLVRPTHPQWLNILPHGLAAQLVALLALVALGVGLQWQLFLRSPRPHSASDGDD